MINIMGESPIKRIVCVGQGMGLGYDDNPKFSDWMFSLTANQSPRILYVPTAAGESNRRIFQFKANLADYPCEVSVLSLFDRQYTDTDLRKFILSHDMIYVEGGNTANMLAIWETHGLRPIFQEAYERGIVLSGKSAGALCWFEGGGTDSFGPELKPITNTFGFLEGSYAPHFQPNDWNRRLLFEELVRNGKLPNGIAVPDGVTLSYENGVLVDIIAENQELRAELVSAGAMGEQNKELKPNIVMPKIESAEVEAEIMSEFGFRLH